MRRTLQRYVSSTFALFYWHIDILSLPVPSEAMWSSVLGGARNSPHSCGHVQAVFLCQSKNDCWNARIPSFPFNFSPLCVMRGYPKSIIPSIVCSLVSFVLLLTVCCTVILLFVLNETSDYRFVAFATFYLLPQASDRPK